MALLDSMESLHVKHGELFYSIEWAFTILFTVEYAIRLLVIKHPLRFARSFYGIIAVPTGIYTAELATSLRRKKDGRGCESCGHTGHDQMLIFVTNVGQNYLRRP